MKIQWKQIVRAAITAFVLAGGSVPAMALSPVSEDSLAAALDRAMATGYTTGIAVAVVQGDHLLWSAQRGFADREAGRRVTTDTRFYIASTTKALTALAAARLADRGELDLAAPLSRVLPKARLHAGLSADSIRVVDLLTHTHGIDADGPVSVRVAYTGDYTYADLLRALATQGPASTGRAFSYSNLGYDLVGILLDPVHKGGWKRVVEREVTVPLGMRFTTGYRSKVRDAEVAMPYKNTPDGFDRIALAKQDANMGPAGGLFSTAGDLARFVIAELDGGRVDGRECIPARVIAETQRARVAQASGRMGYPRFAWGLGWDLGTYEGDTLIHRFGGFPGYSSHVSFLPAHGIGVVVLANGGISGMGLGDVVANALYDRLLGRPDAAARLAAQLDTLRVRVSTLRQSIAADLARRAARSQQLSHPLAAYAGSYVNRDWGTLTLRVNGSRLEAQMGVAQSAVEVYDAATDKLRVELLGHGEVLEAIFPTGGARVQELRLENASYVRR